MRDLSKLLWADLSSDEERIEFIQSGRASETGIGFAPVVVPEIVELLRFRIKHTAQKTARIRRTQ